MTYLYSDSIVKPLFLDPITSLGANKLCILAEHASPNMASWLLKTYEEKKIYNISIELIIGDTLNLGIDVNSHEAFKELHGNRYSKKWGYFSCSYLYMPPEFSGACFIWLKDEYPVKAFSSNFAFTQQSLLRKGQNKLIEQSENSLYNEYVSIINRTIFCNHAEVEDYIIIHSPNSSLNNQASIPIEQSVTLSFITRTGETGEKSGLNWGQRKNRNKNEAYIPLPSKIAKSGFFPLNKQHFLVVTDDHHTLQLRVEQQNDKAITTPASNALLGEYFRNRLGLANGAYIHAGDLNNYGRSDVTFIKIDDEHYYMDFSSFKAK